MEYTKIETLNDINLAIVEAVALPMSPLKAKRLRAARLADLHEMRARVFADAGKAAGDLVPDVYKHAANMAAKRDMDQVRFFRTQAGAR
jgi:hypothetical protein